MLLVMIDVGEQPIALFRLVPTHTGESWTRSATVIVLPRIVIVDCPLSRLNALPAERFIHDRPHIQVNHFPFPPWQNTALILDLPSGLPVVSIFLAWQRRRLEGALQRAGFGLRVRRRWAMGTTM